MSFVKNIEKKYSLREKCPNSEFFSSPYFPVFGLNTERYSVFRHFSCSYFVKLPLVANSEPRVILFFS